MLIDCGICTHDTCLLPEFPSHLMQDPIAIVGILGILLPFVILGIAIGTGYVDVSPKMAKY